MAGPVPAALSRARRFLPYLPPLALAVVAVAQFALAHGVPLSPWKGGGFGMFATLDQPRARTLRVHVLTDDGAFAVMDGPGDESLLAWPRRASLREAAREAACGRWRLAPLDSVGAVAAPSPVWDWVYRSPTLRERSALAGVAGPAAEGEPAATVRAARAVVTTTRIEPGAASSRVRSEVVAEATIGRAEAGCPGP